MTVVRRQDSHIALANSPPMSQPDIKSHIAKRIEQARHCYTSDLEALGEDGLRLSPGGAARTAYDFTYETVFVNRRIAMRLRGETPPEQKQDGLMVAPPDFCSKAVAMTQLRESTDEVLIAWNALSADELEKTLATPGGDSTPLAMASLCATHLMYHDAQLNYTQALHGDTDVHWAEP